MSADLTALIALQKAELELKDTIRRRETIPSQIAEFERRRTERAEALEALEEDLKETASERSRLYGELEMAEEKRRKYRIQLNEVKTNKEYTAVLDEIDQAAKEIADKDEAVLLAMDREEELNTKIADSTTAFAEESRKIDEEIAELKRRGEVLAEREAEQRAAVREAQGAVPEEGLETFRKVAANRDGLALSRIEGETCTACQVRVRPQVLVEVKHQGAIRYCSGCRRIRYWADDAPSAPAADKPPTASEAAAPPTAPTADVDGGSDS